MNYFRKHFYRKPLFAGLTLALAFGMIFSACDLEAVLPGEFLSPFVPVTTPDGPFDPLDPEGNPVFPNLDPERGYLFILICRRIRRPVIFQMWLSQAPAAWPANAPLIPTSACRKITRRYRCPTANPALPSPKPDASTRGSKLPPTRFPV